MIMRLAMSIVSTSGGLDGMRVSNCYIDLVLLGFTCTVGGFNSRKHLHSQT